MPKIDETVIVYKDADDKEQRVYRRDYDDDFRNVYGHPEGVETVPDDSKPVAAPVTPAPENPAP